MKLIKFYKKTYQERFIILLGFILLGFGERSFAAKANLVDLRNCPSVIYYPNPDSLADPKTESEIRKYVCQEFGQDYTNLTKAYVILWAISGPSDNKFVNHSTPKENKDFLDIVQNSPKYFLEKPNLELNPNSIVPNTEQAPPIMSAWDLFLRDYPLLKNNPKYLDQLTKISFVILVLDAGKIWRSCHHSYTEKEKSSFRKNSHQFSDLISDIAELKRYGESFPGDGKKLGPSMLSKFQFINPNFLSSKQDWGIQRVKTDSSLVSDLTVLPSAKTIQAYYLPRWNLYRDYIQYILDNRKKIDPNLVETKFQLFDQSWSKLSHSMNHRNSVSKPDLQKLYLKYRDLNFRVE